MFKSKKKKNTSTQQSSTETIIECLDLNKSYKQGNYEHKILNKVNITIKKGDFISIAGVRGSGKTTLINCITGIEDPDSGRVYIGDRPLDKMTENEKSDLVNKEISVLFHELNLLENLTVEQNIRFAIKTKEHEDIQKITELWQLGKDILHRKVRDLNLFEKIKISLIMTLVNIPKLLLLDDITAGLTSEEKKEIIRTLEKLNREKNIAMLLATDDIDVALMFRKVMRLNDGRVG